MERLADRIVRLTGTRIDPLIPLAELRALLRADGCPVSGATLMAVLRADNDHFRVLRPWKGILEPLRPSRMDPGHGAAARLGEPDTCVLLLSPEAADEATPTGAVLRALTRLGRSLDERSALDRSRWLRLWSEFARAA